MIDLGFDKLALIGVVALVVIGPEKLPRVARTVGTLLGKAQRYVADVKAEVNRAIEIEELHKMKKQFETAAHDMEQSLHKELHQASAALTGAHGASSAAEIADTASYTMPSYKKPRRKNWRLKRSAVPAWYKQRAGVRTHAQSGAARVARFRPRRGP